jgi:hypothetical protein
MALQTDGSYRGFLFWIIFKRRFDPQKIMDQHEYKHFTHYSMNDRAAEAFALNRNARNYRNKCSNCLELHRT